jgi:hypothetical protein
MNWLDAAGPGTETALAGMKRPLPADFLWCLQVKRDGQQRKIRGLGKMKWFHPNPLQVGSQLLDPVDSQAHLAYA